MLFHFLNRNRLAIAQGVRARAATRSDDPTTDAELQAGVLVFLSKLSDLLFMRHAAPAHSDVEERREIARAGAEHGRRLQERGLSAAHAVHDYGDVARALMELAAAQHVSFSGEEYETLSLCVDAAIAGAVTAHASASQQGARDDAPAESATGAVWERMPTPRPASRAEEVAWTDGLAGNRTESRAR